MHSITRHTAGSLVLLIALVGIAACGGSGEVGILINLANLPARTTRIALRGTLDGRPALTDQTELAVTGLNRVGIKVPAMEKGNLSIDLTIYDADHCIQGSSTLGVNLPTARSTELSAPTNARSPRQCEPLLPCSDRIPCPLARTQDNLLLGVWALSDKDVWAVGRASTVLHWDGTRWSSMNAGIPANIALRSVWASAPNDCWAVGGNSDATSGNIFHFDGTKWTLSYSGPDYLFGVHGTSKNDVFAVGFNGKFLRYNAAGDTWDSINSGVSRELVGVWARSPTDVWMVGGGGILQRFNGSLMFPISLGITTDLYAVHGYVSQTGQPIVYAGGKGGGIRRYDGSEDFGTLNHNGVLATPDAIYVTSSAGTVYKRLAGSANFAPHKVSNDDLYGINLAPNGIAWIVGGGGFQGYIDTRP
jgi:photosystem II stability/assembly factor-like uncharacterized protein